MELKTYLKTKDRGSAIELAEMASVSPEAIYMISSGKRNASPALAVKIEKATNGEVSRYDLREDAQIIWGAQ